MLIHLFSYVLIYNSNLDRAEHLRKSITELRRDLKTWEDNLSVKKSGVDDVQGYMVCGVLIRQRHMLRYLLAL